MSNEKNYSDCAKNDFLEGYALGWKKGREVMTLTNEISHLKLENQKLKLTIKQIRIGF